MSARVIAIDWSGSTAPRTQRSTIWAAEAVDGEVVALWSDRTRDEVVRYLVDEAGDSNLVVGIDFAFSFPLWYVVILGRRPAALWRLLAEERLTARMERTGLSRWMSDPEPPFWGNLGRARAGLAPDRGFRRTERDLQDLGYRPKSIFQLTGAGQVGPASLRGMGALAELSHSFHVWPFAEARLPLLVEIYPASLRNAHVEARIPPDARTNVHARDAAASALAMWDHLRELPKVPDELEYALEGRIWHPRLDLRASSA